MTKIYKGSVITIIDNKVYDNVPFTNEADAENIFIVLIKEVLHQSPTLVDIKANSIAENNVTIMIAWFAH